MKIPLIGPLHYSVTWYKITYTGEQVAQWDFQNNAPAFVLEVPLRNLLTSICNFVPCDQVVQRAYNGIQVLKPSINRRPDKKGVFRKEFVKPIP